jgi:type I restriction enzyme S subunit
MTATKPSGIAWIGEVPSAWEIIRLKQYAYLKGRIGWQGLKAEEFVDEGPYLVTGTDFDKGRVCWERSYHVSEKRYDEAPQIQLLVGDLLVTKDGTIGKLAYIDYLPGKASLNSHLLVVRPLCEKFCNEFLYWVLGSTVFQGYYELASDGSTMDSLSQEKIGNLHFAIPPLAEQRAIAAFLDDRCGQVDGIIADLVRQVEIMRQYKKALITETVSQNLSHWMCGRIKDLMTLQRGYDLPQDDFVEGEYPVYGSNGIVGYHNKFTTKGPGITVGRSGSAGEVNYVDGDFWSHTTSIFVKDRKGNIMRVLYYVLLSFDIKELASGSAVPTLDRKNVESVHLMFPTDKAEQHAIADFLDAKCAETDNLITEKERSIETMRQYKKSLIYEYVTGKKRVADGGAVS